MQSLTTRFDSLTGFLYPPGDYETAVTLTKQLVRDRALRERVGGAARLEVCLPCFIVLGHM